MQAGCRKRMDCIPCLRPTVVNWRFISSRLSCNNFLFNLLSPFSRPSRSSMGKFWVKEQLLLIGLFRKKFMLVGFSPLLIWKMVISIHDDLLLSLSFDNLLLMTQCFIRFCQVFVSLTPALPLPSHLERQILFKIAPLV